MQVSKSFSGEVTLEETTTRRKLSYGTTTTAAVYPSKVDTLNTIIADFLSGSCGVNAWYGSAGDEDDSFLWIFGCPFLFLPSTKTISSTVYSNVLFYGPCYASSICYYKDSNTNFPLFYKDTGAYSFGLVFSGNPNNGFVLRFKMYNSANVNSLFNMRFIKANNLINGSDAVVFSGKSSTYDSSLSKDEPSGFNGIDLSGPSGIIDPGSFSTALMTYTPLLETKAIHRTHNEGALPLVPLCVGPYRANGIFLRPKGFSLPNAVGAGVEILPEVTISGRSFLITNSDSFSAGYVNMGLIETT